MPKFLTITAVLLIAAMPLLARGGNQPAPPAAPATAGIASCPASPNCVSSAAQDTQHRIPPFQLAMAPAEAWQTTRELVAELPRTHIVQETADYLHAECRSALFGFVDDLELQLRPMEGIIAVRSAARMGYSDLGVNRRRVERLRVALLGREVLK